MPRILGYPIPGILGATSRRSQGISSQGSWSAPSRGSWLPCPGNPMVPGPRDPGVPHPGVLGMSDADSFGVPVGTAWRLGMPRVGPWGLSSSRPCRLPYPTLCQNPRAGAGAMVADRFPVLGMARRVPSASASRPLWWGQAARLRLGTAASSGPARERGLPGREAAARATARGFRELSGALFAGSKAGGSPEPPALWGCSTSWGQTRAGWGARAVAVPGTAVARAWGTP